MHDNGRLIDGLTICNFIHLSRCETMLPPDNILRDPPPNNPSPVRFLARYHPRFCQSKIPLTPMRMRIALSQDACFFFLFLDIYFTLGFIRVS